jgi:hypothetical protein
LHRPHIPAFTLTIRFLLPVLPVLVVAVAAMRTAHGAGTPPGGLAGGAPIASAADCKRCHGGFPTDDGKLYMPWDTWAGSMMANAARDPLFLASLTIAEQDRPGSGGFCLRCHTPSAYVASHTTPGDGSALDDVDREGVQCAVCHRSVDGSKPPISDANAPYIGNAQITFDVGTAYGAPYRGPYDDSSSSVHDTIGDPFTSGDDSRLCGQCHQVDNPGEHLYDASGADTGKPFPLDTTYEEWQQSSYASGAGARSCQSCHMPAVNGSYEVGSGAGNRDMPPRHDFVGGNDWGPALLKAAFPGLRDAQYDYTRATAQASLAAAAKLEIKALPVFGPAAGSVAATVRVTNLAGHKFPTGYADGRRAWLEVAVVGAGGGVDVQSGAYDATTGVLAEDNQLRLYEAVHGRDGSPEDHIVLHRQILRDTRIPPAGFTPTAATKPIGPISFSDGAGGVNAFDDASFQIALPLSPGSTVTVRVRLVYQAMTAAHVAALAAANTTDDRGTKLMQLWQQTGGAAPFVMAEVTRPVAVVLNDAEGGVSDAGLDGSPKGGGGSGGGGCGCATAPSRVNGLLAFLLIVLGAAAARRRGRRRRD